jgi:hypothetical protein
MKIIHKHVKIYSYGKSFAFRFDTEKRASLAYVWLSWSSYPSLAVKVWKVKISLELG